MPTKCSTVTYTNVGSDPVWVDRIDWSLVDPSGAETPFDYADPATELGSGYLDAGEGTTGDACFATEQPPACWDLIYAQGHDSSAPGAVFTG